MRSGVDARDRHAAEEGTDQDEHDGAGHLSATGPVVISRTAMPSNATTMNAAP